MIFTNFENPQYRAEGRQLSLDFLEFKLQVSMATDHLYFTICVQCYPMFMIIGQNA